MILTIDTTDNQNIKLSLKNNEGKVFDFVEPAPRQQGERLLPAVEKILKKAKAKLKDVKEVRVGNSGGSFTSLRIGVTTANALAYAIGAKIGSIDNDLKAGEIGVVEPLYDSEPDIGGSKHKK
jgi:tRNA threonylcarbamoyladenosine biosynthesis protein TsaB